MSKVISFESRVGKAQTGQTSGGFTAIKPLNNHSLFLFFYSFFIIYSLQLFSSTYLSILFDFSTSSLSLSLSLCFVFLIRNKEVSAWNFSIFWAIFTTFFFLLDDFRPPFAWFLRRTCTGLCVHSLYISSNLDELVLVFLWESEKYIPAEFWFRPVLTETVTWEREREEDRKSVV